MIQNWWILAIQVPWDKFLSGFLEQIREIYVNLTHENPIDIESQKAGIKQYDVNDRTEPEFWLMNPIWRSLCSGARGGAREDLDSQIKARVKCRSIWMSWWSSPVPSGMWWLTSMVRIRSWACRHPREVLPRGQDPCSAVRCSCRWPRHEDQVHSQAAQLGRFWIRVPSHENEAGHRDDRDRLYSTGER